MKKKRTFIPYGDKIVVEPTTVKPFLQSDQQTYEEVGIVKAIGNKVKFVKVGDTLFFASWGVLKTSEVDGDVYYVVPESSEFILGKFNGTKTK